MSQFLKISIYLTSIYLHTSYWFNFCENIDHHTKQNRNPTMSSMFGHQCAWNHCKCWPILTRNAEDCIHTHAEQNSCSYWLEVASFFQNIDTNSIPLNALFFSQLPTRSESNSLYTLEIQLQHKSDGFQAKNDDPIPKPTQVFWHDFTVVMVS